MIQKNNGIYKGYAYKSKNNIFYYTDDIHYKNKKYIYPTCIYEKLGYKANCCLTTGFNFLLDLIYNENIKYKKYF